MDDKNGFTINKRDRVLRAWQLFFQNMLKRKLFTLQSCFNFFANLMFRQGSGINKRIEQFLRQDIWTDFPVV